MAVTAAPMPQAPPGIRMRPGVPGDAARIAELIVRENHRPADRDAIATSLATAPSIVAFDGEEMVAFFYGRPFAPDIVEMQNMLIAASHRRRGLGLAVVARIEEDLRQAGYRAAIGANSILHRGTTPERCMTARAFWVRMGWRIMLATGGSVVLVRWLGPGAHPEDGITAPPS
ncbi:MAG: GNAT family N-acetyltransferase [Thermoleophilia bacterium]|nr:GNAT family N-acetyltransferase [Thermoleophilia bacterium]